MATSIVRAVRRHADELTELMHSSAAYRGRYASILHGYQVSPDDIDRHVFFRAVDTEGGLVGFYALHLDPPELDLLFVADVAQRQGLGRELITHMLGQARAAGLPGVRVVAHPQAAGFYRRMGARQTATVRATPPRITWDRPELWFDITATGPRH